MTGAPTFVPLPARRVRLLASDVGWAKERITTLTEDVCLRCEGYRPDVVGTACTPTHPAARAAGTPGSTRHRWAGWEGRDLVPLGIHPDLFKIAARADPASLEWLASVTRTCLGRGHLLHDTDLGASTNHQWSAHCLVCERQPWQVPFHHRVLIPHPTRTPETDADPRHDGRLLMEESVDDLRGRVAQLPDDPAPGTAVPPGVASRSGGCSTEGHFFINPDARDLDDVDQSEPCYYCGATLAEMSGMDMVTFAQGLVSRQAPGFLGRPWVVTLAGEVQHEPTQAVTPAPAPAGTTDPVYRIPPGHPAAEHPYPLDSHAVDAAARVIYARTGRTGWDGPMDDLTRHHYLKTAQMVLEAAVPHLTTTTKA